MNFRLQKRYLIVFAGCVIILVIIFLIFSSDMFTGEYLSLKAIPQDKQIFLTWIGNANLLSWKPVDADEWNNVTLSENDGSQKVIEGLINDKEYMFKVVKTTDINLLGNKSSPIVYQKPREKVDYFFVWETEEGKRVGIANEWELLNNWVIDNGFDVSEIKCRGDQVQWNKNSPDCCYIFPNAQILLFRALDDKLAVSPIPEGPADIIRYRELAKKSIWKSINPFDNPNAFVWESTDLPTPNTGLVQGHRKANSFEIKYKLFTSRITRFVPFEQKSNLIAIYHEGHSASSVIEGADTINYLLKNGWEVYAMDMPLEGRNDIDRTEEISSHYDMNFLDNGDESPLSYFFLPVKAVIDKSLAKRNSNDITLMMLGRSGGGWTTYVYSAIDERVDIAVSIAGGVPESLRLHWSKSLGDYEEILPALYNNVSHDELMWAAGSKASLYFYNTQDSCCYRVNDDIGYEMYIESPQDSLGKQIDIYIDVVNKEHTISNNGYKYLDTFLEKYIQ